MHNPSIADRAKAVGQSVLDCLCALWRHFKSRYVTKVENAPGNEMIRLGSGRNQYRWYIRLDLWSVGYRLARREEPEVQVKAPEPEAVQQPEQPEVMVQNNEPHANPQN